MNTSKNINEALSTLADGEAGDAEIDAALAVLATEEGRAQWALIHQIGDAIRSDDMVTAMSPEFQSRLFARLDAEPVVLAPTAAQAPRDATLVPAPQRGRVRRFAIPGLAAAAVAAFALSGGSQLMVARQASPAGEATVMLASASLPTSASQAATGGHAVSVSAGQGEVLRDPDIDQYLMAHQRFSPSLYSTAQYARGPAFTNESGK